MIVVTVPGQPRGWGRAWKNANGVTFTDPKTRSYERELKAAGVEAMAGRPPLEGPLQLTVLAAFYPPKSGTKAQVRGRLEGWIRPITKPDADNIAKVMDGLNRIVWVDDAQIVRLVVDKVYDLEPRLVMAVEPWSLL